MPFGRICFVPSRAKRSSVTFASDLQGENAHLKCDTGDTEDRLCDRVQLRGVTNLPIPMEEN